MSSAEQVKQAKSFYHQWRATRRRESAVTSESQTPLKTESALASEPQTPSKTESAAMDATSTPSRALDVGKSHHTTAKTPGAARITKVMNATPRGAKTEPASRMAPAPAVPASASRMLGSKLAAAFFGTGTGMHLLNLSAIVTPPTSASYTSHLFLSHFPPLRGPR